MEPTIKEYRKDLWLFVTSIAVLIYTQFMNYIYIMQLENIVLRAIMEFITIPMMIMGIIVPVLVVYRHINKKTQNRTLSMLSLLFSLLTFVLIGYISF